MAMLKGRRVVLGVTGSIAAYKSAFLVRELVKAGAEVRVVMTPGAREFITPLTLGTLSGHPVHSELTDDREAGTWTDHVELGLWGDVVLVAPATAHTLAGMVEGRGDSLLSDGPAQRQMPGDRGPGHGPRHVHPPGHHLQPRRAAQPGCPRHRTRRGRARQRPRKARGASPTRSASGRNSRPGSATTRPCSGYRALITVGPTHEPVDAVRFLGNRSSGRQGVAIAMELARRGMTVDLIAGPIASTRTTPASDRRDVGTALEMNAAAQAALRPMPPTSSLARPPSPMCDLRHPIDGKAAKVRPADLHRPHRESRHPRRPQCRRSRPPASRSVCPRPRRRTRSRPSQKDQKGCDLVVLNSLADKGAGFGHTTNRVRFVHGPDRIDSFELKSKDAVAADLAEVIQARLLQRPPIAPDTTH